MSRLPAATATLWRPALEEGRALSRQLKQNAAVTVALTPGDAAAQQLAERLLGTLREGIQLCAHFDPRRPAYTIWMPGNTGLSCTFCTIIDQATTGDDEHCDLCGRHQSGDIGAVALVVGPVGVMALACSRCTSKKLRATYDLAGAGRQVIAILEARRRVGAS